MVSSPSVPWYNRPPRPFPAKEWLEARYGFRLPPLHFAPPPGARSAATSARRPFPAQVWLAARQQRARRL